MMDAAWLACLIRHGETALALRQAGHTWREIADELHLGDVPTVQRAAALYLSADLASRQAAQDRAGDAQPQAGADAPAATQRTASGKR